MYKINDWNMNRLFVRYMRVRHNDLTKYLSNQGVINYYKEKYIYEFGRVVMCRGIKREIESFIKKIKGRQMNFPDVFKFLDSKLFWLIIIWLLVSGIWKSVDIAIYLLNICDGV